MPSLSNLSLPDFGLPTQEPQLEANIYQQRLQRLCERALEAGFQRFVVYADREHFANMAYLSGYDPRFEEALLIIDPAEPGRKPWLLVGNEGWGFAGISPIRDSMELVLYQPFSLLGQDRSRSARLDQILREAGIDRGVRIGVAGWKHFGTVETDSPNTWLDIPSFIADTLRACCGEVSLVENANALLMDSSRGLRAINEVEQLARFEFAATYASQAVRNVLFQVEPGLSELAMAERMRLNGWPLSCHLMLSAGERAFLGMGSPSSRAIRRGDPFTTAVGLWGALTSRAGFVVESAAELPTGIRDYVEKLVGPYFNAIAHWYEAVGIGVSGAELYEIIHSRIGDPFFGVKLNPGHLIHLDEWVNSPVYAGSKETLQSGMALQVDVIPGTGTAYYTTNIEDGIALADDSLRAQFQHQYPEAWGRIQARRQFMENQLGIRLKPEVLPFSNLPAYLPPFLLSPERAMVMG